MGRRALVAGGILLGVAGCAAPRERMAPAASGSGRVERDIAYGPHPRQRLDVYQPPPVAGGPARPVIVYLHGGLWSNGSKEDLSSTVLPQALMARGAVVVVPNFRLFPETPYPGFMRDAAAAVAWAREGAAALGGDPRGVFVAGHSSGAHMAVLVALDPGWLTEAEGGAATGRPALAGAIGLSGVYGRQAFDLAIIRPIFAAAADREAVLPGRFLRPGMPPLLLIHGSWDWQVPAGESVRLAAAAREAGGQAELRLYSGFGHFDILAAGPFLPSLSPAADDIAAFVRSRQAEANSRPR